MNAEELSKVHIFFPLLMYNHTCVAEFMEKFLDMSLMFQKCGLKFSYKFITTESLINRGRNTAIIHFLNCKEATHCMFIDSDVIFHFSQVIVLLENIHKYKLGIVAGSYPKKEFMHERLKSNPNLPYDCLTDHPICGRFGGNSLLMDLECLPTGFMMFTKKMILKVIKDNKDKPNFMYINDIGGYPDSPLPGGEKYMKDLLDEQTGLKNGKQEEGYKGLYANLFQLFVHPELHTLLSEDYSFSFLVRQSGFRTCIVPDLSLIHMGWFYYKGNLAHKISEWDMKQEGNVFQKSLKRFDTSNEEDMKEFVANKDKFEKIILEDGNKLDALQDNESETGGIQSEL